MDDTASLFNKGRSGLALSLRPHARLESCRCRSPRDRRLSARSVALGFVLGSLIEIAKPGGTPLQQARCDSNPNQDEHDTADELASLSEAFAETATDLQAKQRQRDTDRGDGDGRDDKIDAIGAEREATTRLSMLNAAAMRTKRFTLGSRCRAPKPRSLP